LILKIGSLLLALGALTPYCYAVETRFWIQNEQADFEKGTLKNLSLRSDGHLALAPVFKEQLASSAPYLWALAEDSKGNLYSAGGGPGSSQAKIFVIDAAGKSKVLAELPGMEVHALAIDSKDRIFAATSPDGKIFRVSADGKSEVFYDPKAKYIWGMVFDSKGNLFVATGDQGEVHRVAPDGKGTVFFRTEETHARSIAIDSKDNVILGTEPGGLVIRISPAGDGFVLYQAAKREITAVAIAKDGTIYAAGVGNKGSGGSGPAPAQISIPPASIASAPGAAARVSSATSTPPPAVAAPPISGGSELYRIETDNFARRIWSHAQDVAYAVVLDAQNHPIVGTGNKGNIYRIDSDTASTLLINALPTQITTLLSGSKGRLYAGTGNIGNVYQIGPEIEKQGTYESDPYDVGSFSYWGRLIVKCDAGGGKVAFETRSGNLDRPHKNWSPWANVDPEGAARVSSPSARFLQYRATLSAGNSGKSPTLREVEIAYMSKNIAPAIEDVEVTPANYKFPPPPATQAGQGQSVTLPPLGQHRRPSTSVIADTLSTQTLQYAKGQLGARWAVSDPNGDEMIYNVEIRGVNESEWKLLREKVKEKFLTWDSTAFPDGRYRLRITASDSPGNPPGQALSNQLESDSFMIDNTPPQITGLTGSRSGSQVSVRWKAKDALSVLENAEYSIDGKEWLAIEPTTRLTDSLEHDYVLTLDGIAAGEHTLAVRVSDEFDNQSVDKIVIH
jgi:sugar lactone lactonase YvrE